VDQPGADRVDPRDIVNVEPERLAVVRLSDGSGKSPIRASVNSPVNARRPVAVDLWVKSAAFFIGAGHWGKNRHRARRSP
jgi:hypothetical protein